MAVSLDISEGVRVLKKALQDYGPLPVRRLVGYLSSVKRPVREAIGRNKEELLRFLIADDRFKVEGAENIVSLSKPHESSKLPPKKSVTEAQSKPILSPIVTNANLAKDPNPVSNSCQSPNQIQIKNGVEFLVGVLSVTGPLPLKNLAGHLGSTSKSIRDTVGSNPTGLLEFLRRNNSFTITGKDNVVSIRSKTLNVDERTEAVVRANSPVSSEIRSKECLNDAQNNLAVLKPVVSTLVNEKAKVVTPDSYVKSISSSSPISIQNEKKGMNYLLKILNVNGPMPLNRLTGYLGSTDESIRGTIGCSRCTQSNLLAFLNRNDIFEVREKDNIVAIRSAKYSTLKEVQQAVNIKMSTCTASSIAGPEMHSMEARPLNASICAATSTSANGEGDIVSVKQKESVAVKPKAIATIKPMVTEPLLLPVNSKQIVPLLKSAVQPVLVTSKDILGQNLSTPLLSSIDLAKLAVTRVFTKALQKKSPQKYSSLLCNLNETTEIVRAAMRESNTSYLDFLRSDNSFRVIEHVEPNNCIISLNTEWSHQNVSTIKKTDVGCDPLITGYEQQKLVEINVQKQTKLTVMSPKVTVENETSAAKKAGGAAVISTTIKNSVTDSAEKLGIQHLKKVLSQRSPMTVDSLHGYLSLSGMAVREALGRNPKGLLQFLKNNKHFIVDKNTNMIRLNTDRITSLKGPGDSCTFSNVDKLQNSSVSTAANSIESSNVSEVSTVAVPIDSKFVQFPESKLSSDILASSLKHNQLPMQELSSNPPAPNPYSPQLSTTNACSNTPTYQLNPPELSTVKLSPVSRALNTESSHISVTKHSKNSTILKSNTSICKQNRSHRSTTKCISCCAIM